MNYSVRNVSVKDSYTHLRHSNVSYSHVKKGSINLKKEKKSEPESLDTIHIDHSTFQAHVHVSVADDF